ncbi:hypothetical protein HZC07_05875 [Candidatus Micrarchaeota archaeon]|nr:hypothetical protein [Candidatus Micrarchaeota archaeon]
MTVIPNDGSARLRGPLTFREKARAALFGLTTFHPLLEIVSRGLDPTLPREERIKYAVQLGKSTSTGRIYDHIVKEHDSVVSETLVYSFVEAYHRKLGAFTESLCNCYSAMAARTIAAEREQYKYQIIGQAATLLAVSTLSYHARSVLESVVSDISQA